MNMRATRWLTPTLVLAMTSVLAGKLSAQEDSETGWAFTAEISGVWTAGNSESNTLGLAGTLTREWARSLIKFEGGAIRTESGTTTRTAVGTIDDFEVVKETVRTKTAENYYLRGKYDYKISERFFALAGADWLRNTFAGIDSRLLLALGAGNIWLDAESMRLTTDYAATYSFQEDVVDNPLVKSDFPGLRLSYDFWWQLTSSTKLESRLVGDLNLDTTDDVRLDFTNALPVSISSKLAFKPSLQLLWRNDPALTEVALETPAGEPTGETVAVPLNKLDSFFTLALVVKL
jgi:putative salt-induced outer membrane protein YdiY